MIYPVSLTLHSIMINFIVDPSIWHYSVISKLNRILYHSFKTLIEYGEKIQFLKIATKKKANIAINIPVVSKQKDLFISLPIFLE